MSPIQTIITTRKAAHSVLLPDNKLKVANSKMKDKCYLLLGFYSIH